MAKPKFCLEKKVSVGIWDGARYIAQVYADKIVVKSPYVKWTGNSGSLAVLMQTIRTPAVIAAVLADLAVDDDDEGRAWQRIGDVLCDGYLAAW